MNAAVDLPTVWFLILGIAVLAYVVMDGFDLGIGILFPFFAVGKERDTAMNSIAPVWDGNETWLVLGGGGLMAAFPLDYAIIMPAVYAPVIAMLLALIFRGVAFEFRWRDPGHRKAWDVAFTVGSIVAALAQGITLGAVLQGIVVKNNAYAGGWWDWLSAFSILVGISLVIGYALLGATWLIMKSEGSLQDHSFRFAKWLGGATFLCIVIVSAATPFLQGEYYLRWFQWPRILFTSQVPLLVLISSIWLFVSIRKRRTYSPFLATLVLFTLTLAGLGVSVFPEAVPPTITFQQAAAPDASLKFLLVGASVLIPIILVYSGYSYWVFRGKTGHEGYH